MAEEIALEVIDAAASKITIKEFELRCRFTPVKPGKSFFDIKRVATKFISDGTIQIINDRLTLSSLNLSKMLKNQLSVGNPVAWDILDKIDPNGDKTKKFNNELLSQIGLDGEIFFINHLISLNTSISRKNIRHISLVDDSTGFDIIAPSLTDPTKNMLAEVKTSTRPGRYFHLYLSRNEARVGSINNNWYIACVSSKNSKYSVEGHLLFDDIADLLPTDNSPSAKWESVCLRIENQYIRHSLP